MFNSDKDTHTEQVEINFGTALKLRRERLGITQLELAEAVGVNQSTVAKWEQRATTMFSTKQLELLAQVLHAPVRDIRAGIVPRSMVNPDTEESMLLGPMRDLQRLRQLDGLLYDTAITTLAALRREAERKEARNRYTAGQSSLQASQSVQGIMYDVEDSDKKDD